MAHVGAPIDRYVVLEHLSEGGMGAILCRQEARRRWLRDGGRAQAAAAGVHAARGVHRSVPARGEAVGDARSREHHPHDRSGDCGRRVLHRDGVPARRRSADPAAQGEAPRQAVHAEGRDLHLARGALGARIRALEARLRRQPSEADPSRRVAVERAAVVHRRRSSSPTSASRRRRRTRRCSTR